jgi:hypothetical protein
MRHPRQLTFNDWDSIVAELQQLLLGYDMTGNWNLSQTALHLNDWLRFPMDGYPESSWAMQKIMGIMRTLMGASLLKRTLARGFGSGTATLPESTHSPSESHDTDAVELLLQTIARFRQHPGAIHPSPLFGAMDYATAQKLQFMHFAHHLGRLIPYSR